MDPQIFIERILETANLTDNLEDTDADQLLRWGAAQVPAMVDGLTDEETAGERVSALMAFMRHVNRIIGDRPNLSLEEAAVMLEKLAERRLKAFGAIRSLTADEYRASARMLWALSVHDALPFLITFAAPDETGIAL